jgi:glycerol-3-phosphate acyltransferase PlsY
MNSTGRRQSADVAARPLDRRPSPSPGTVGAVGATRTLAAVAAGYLLGTIPSADVAARLATHGAVDLRQAGSGSPGGANAYKVLGPAWGYGVMAADIGKGTAAGFLGRWIGGSSGSNAAAAAAVVGHCFPVWSRFAGGKGVATSVGQCFTTFPAWFPVDIGVAIMFSGRRFKARARTATLVSSSLWVAAAWVWWRRRWPNFWGGIPTSALPLATAVSSAVIAHRFLSVPDPTIP